jgi:hypothetical protein
MSRKGRLGRRPFLLPATRNDSPLKGKPETGMLPADTMHSQVPGLCHRVSGSGVRHQVQVQAFLDVSYLCTFARGHAAFAPLHFITCTRTRT